MNSKIPTKNRAGVPRKVGFELEFSGLKLEQAAELIKSLYGGSIQKNHRYRYTIKDTKLGTFRVELDARNLRRLANENAFKGWGIDFDNEGSNISVEDIVDRLAQSVVPLEVVMPPVPLQQVEELEELRSALQQNKAEGTKTSLMHAFGMHINIECPALDAQSLLNHLRAFLLLYPWLVEKCKIDLTRKVTPFVDRFPEEYGQLILDPSYQPDKPALIDDYLAHNPTRNRPLDMMPIWAMDAPDKVRAALDDEKNAPRPTFHYRLPNSHVDDPDWRLRQDLDYWMKVEELANKPKTMGKLSQLYRLQKERIIVPFNNHWIETITILLDLDE